MPKKKERVFGGDAAAKGCTTEQLLVLWDKYSKLGLLQETSKVEDFIHKIALPESKQWQCTFADVLPPDGATPARAVVSHSTQSRFKCVVRAITQEAGSLTRFTVEEEIMAGGLTDRALLKSYWLFPVSANLHLPAQNDTLNGTISSMECLIVVLDAEMKTMERTWCLAEIDHALTLNNRIIHVLPEKLAVKFRRGDVKLPGVKHGHTADAGDQERFLKQIESSCPGGTREFDQNIAFQMIPAIRRLALAEAVDENGHMDLQVLLGTGADFTVAGIDGQTPFCKALLNGHSKCAMVLLEKKADPNENPGLNGGMTPLQYAAEAGDMDLLTNLLEKKADPDSRDWEDTTLLHMACQIGNRLIADRVLHARANPDVVCTSEAVAPMHMAAKEGHRALVDLLFEKKANPNPKTSTGATPLGRATWAGHATIVEILLARGADAHAKTDNGSTTLHAAASCGHVEIVSMLLDADADPYAANTRGQTPYQVAGASGHRPALQGLLGLGPQLGLH